MYDRPATTLVPPSRLLPRDCPRAVKHPMWEAQRLEAEAALPIPPDIDNEFPVLRWKSEDYVPAPK